MSALALRRLLPRSSPLRVTRVVPARQASTASSSSTGSNSALRLGVYATAFAVSTGLFAIYYFDSRSAIHRYVLTPVLRYTFDAETGHQIAVKVLRSGLGPRDTQIDDEILKVNLLGQTLKNPLGLAAGFDKNGEAIDGLFNLGFSWVEIGSVTPKPQPGNPKPRVFHLTSDAALINRYGFPSEGHVAVLNRLTARLPTFSQSETASLHPNSLLAVNLGKNKSSAPDSISDFEAGVRAFSPYADVLVVNVSSPNTPGLRGLQNRALLEELLSGVIKTRDEVASLHNHRKPKVVLKIAPDLNENDIKDIAEAVRASEVDGVIVSNTTVKRPPSLSDGNKSEQGGLSGAPLKPFALATLRTLRSHLPSQIPLIGCGGISTGEDALEFAKAGASFVQIYTEFGYDGVGACRRIKDELTQALKKEGTTWEEVVQQAVQTHSWKEPPKVEPSLVGSRGSTIKTLIEEAEDLTKLLDELADKMNLPGNDTKQQDVAVVTSTSTV